jgi:transposase
MGGQTPQVAGKISSFHSSWQAQSQAGFDISCFSVDWDKQQVRCPQGHLSRSWREIVNERDNQVIEVHFDRTVCAACVARKDCTRSPKAPRLLKLRPKAQHQALQAARNNQTTNEFQQAYAQRAGVEGTISQGIRAFDLRRSRYIGLAKTHLQHIATACAMNLSRFMAWFQQVPKAKTRTSPFAAVGLNA